MKIRHIFVSDSHNFFGHGGKPPGNAETVSILSAELVKGKGIVGDRFFGYKKGYKGQVTFFEYETFLVLQDRFAVFDRGPEVFRRNIITEGVDLNTLIGQEFEVQSIRFQGVEEAKPCPWMNQAFCEGAQEALLGKGGLRVQVLSDGVLCVDA